jgi:hypothetical protein
VENEMGRIISMHGTDGKCIPYPILVWKTEGQRLHGKCRHMKIILK